MTVYNRTAKIVIAVTTISAAIMELIDTSIVNVALNQMAGNLGATIEDISWVITSYAIANVIIIPISGFLSQYFGRKRYYLTSILIFTIASVFCGLSTSIWELVFWRFVQGLGGGGLLSTSQAILFSSFSKEQRGLAGGLFGMGIVLGPTLGPTIGGMIIDTYSWPLIFNINVPFGIVASILTYRFIDNDNEMAERPKIDWYGIILLTVGIGSLQYVLERGQIDDWFSSVYIRWFILTFVVGLGGFIFWELNQKRPVVNLSILKDRTLSLTTILTFISGFALFTAVYLFPLLLQRVLGYTAYQTGITLLPSSALSLFLMPVIGKKLQAGTSPKIFIAVGFFLFIVFGLWMSHVDVNVSSGFFILPLMIRGAGLAFLFVPLTSMAVQGLKPGDIPQGIALNNMMRQLGGSLGIAVINNVVAHRFAVHRLDLISNITSSNLPYSERNSMIVQNLQAHLAVTSNVQQQSYHLIDLAVMKQSYFLSYLDAFMFCILFILIAFPLIFIARKKNQTDPVPKHIVEKAH